jgi:hypothetical protein
LGHRLIGGNGLPPELSIDVGSKRNVGDDQRSRWHHVRRDLSFQDIVELAHAVPFLGGGEPGRASHDTTIGGDQEIGRSALDALCGFGNLRLCLRIALQRG